MNSSLRFVPAVLLAASFIPLITVAQSWSEPVQVVDESGLGGSLGRYTGLVENNGALGMATIDAHNRLVWVRATDADGNAWDVPVNVLPLGTYAHDLSVAIVNGNPAIAYTLGIVGTATEGLMYVRANDPNGQSWGTPVAVDLAADSGLEPDLEVVNGKPAIAYWRDDTFFTTTHYVQASDADGQAWGAPVQVSGNTFFGALAPDLEVVNGHPAVAYHTSAGLLYRRASDADGSAWAVADTLRPGLDHALIELKVIGGIPCLAYKNTDQDQGEFMHALDADGAAWSGYTTIYLTTGLLGLELMEVEGYPAAVVHLEQSETLEYRRSCTVEGTQWFGCGTWGATIDAAAGNASVYPSVAMVNGYPAVAYVIAGSAPTALRYCRASAVNGFAWNAPVAITGRPGVGQYASQCIVGGRPALAYYDLSNKDLRYIRANDALGQTWGPSVVVDSMGDVGSFCSMQLVNGQPAISYYDATNNLKYVRASDALGTTWSAPIALFATGASYGQGTSLAVVAGRPAIAFRNNSQNDVYYIRALDAEGATWPATASFMFSDATTPSLIDLAGVPGVAFSYTPDNDLYFVRGANADGTAWAVHSVVDGTGNTGYYPCLINLAGHPAISYWDVTGTRFRYAYANNVLGLSWSAVTIDDDISGTAFYSSLAVIDGLVACAYWGFTSNRIRIKRSLNATGTNWSVAPINIGTIGSTIAHVNMAANGSDAGISYFEPILGSAYYISGGQCSLGTPAPTNTTPPEDMIACSGTPTTLTVTGSNVTWTQLGNIIGTGNSHTTPAVFITPTFYATDSACYISASTPISVTITTVDVGVTAADDSLTADATGVQYQWLDCNNGYAAVAGATDQSFSGPAGIYAVEITDGACVDTSACMPLINTSLSGLDGPVAVQVFPNPATQKLFITAASSTPLRLALFDASGRAVREVARAKRTSTLDVADLRRGCYVLKVRDATRVSTHVVVLE